MSTTVGKLRRKAQTFENAGLHELMGVFTPWLDLAEALGKPARNRLFSPSRTCWLFLAQVLSADRSCREVVRKFLAWLACTEGKEASPNSSAYCTARARLSMDGIKKVHTNLVDRVQQSVGNQHRWHGRRVTVVDGTGISMPDTAANQEAYPHSKGVKPGLGILGQV